MYKNRAKLNQKKQFLKEHDEELFIHYYVTMGGARSTVKLVDYCALQGWLNPITRKPPSRMAVWFGMWRWAIRPENQERAYQLYNKAKLDDGEYCSREEWLSLLSERAKVCLRDTDFMKWQQNVLA